FLVTFCGDIHFCFIEERYLFPVKYTNPSDTIFAFLMLNTMSPAHNKIFSAKFLSFERAEIVY
ncbi:hypothetical protein, partial [Prevotella sp.]|uniref:hypothetical protein n=1 Tax=Prevotella sp. TaxID=59823 RepID=UPI0040254E29